MRAARSDGEARPALGLAVDREQVWWANFTIVLTCAIAVRWDLQGARGIYENIEF